MDGEGREIMKKGVGWREIARLEVRSGKTEEEQGKRSVWTEDD